MYKLVIKDDESNKTVIAFYRQEITIGREEGNTIRLTEQNVSRTHAKLTKSNNLIFLEDSKSYVGTFLNNEKIEEQVQLNNGDEIKIGDYLITIINEAEDGDDETVLIKDDKSKSKDNRIKPIPVSEITGNKSDSKNMIGNDLDVNYPIKPPYNRIVFQDSNLAGTTFDILKSVMTIGKSPEADIMINNKSLSDIEAKIIYNENSVKIKDISNKGRIKVNGDSYSILELRESDIITIGTTNFRYCDKNSKYIYRKGSSSKKNNKLFAIIGVAIIILGVIIYFVSKSNNKIDKKDITKNIKKDITKNIKKDIKKNNKKEVKKNTINMNDLSPELLNLITTGKQLIKDQNWIKAKKVYVQILKSAPNNKNAKDSIKMINKELGYKKTYIDAIKLFNNKKYRKAIRKFNSLPETSSYKKKYEQKRRESYLKKIISLADKEIKNKRYNEAKDLLFVANDIEKDNDDIVKRIEFVDSKLSRKRERKIIRKSPHKRNTSLAKALFNEGATLGGTKPTAALKKLKAAMRADPYFASPYLTAGMICKRIGRKKQAIIYLSKYLKLNPSTIKAKRIKQWIQDLK